MPAVETPAEAAAFVERQESGPLIDTPLIDTPLIDTPLIDTPTMPLPARRS